MYTITGLISVGSYGRVFQAKRDGQKVAIKEFRIGQKKRSIVGAVNLKEVDHLKRCDHPFILKPISFTYTCPYRDPENLTNSSALGDSVSKSLTDEIYVIMPLAQTTLFRFMGEEECTVPLLKRFMVQITQALAYLHANRICYRDVKSLNVLIFPDEKYSDAYNAILCDMGMCKPMTPEYMNSEHVGTPTYKAPEVVMCPGVYSYSIDVWSLGVLFIEMFNNSNPFDRQLLDGKAKVTDKEVLSKIFKNRGSPGIKVFNKLSRGGNTEVEFSRISKWPKRCISDLFSKDSEHFANFDEVSEGLPNFGTLDQFINLLESMLLVDPEARISMSEVLLHPFFSQVTVRSSESADIWRGLENPLPREPISHVLKKIGNLERRNSGLEIIDRISVNYSREIMFRSMFLGLDLYDRCLIRCEELSKDMDPKLLAYTCCYIACKYFFDESTPDLSVIFPRDEFSREEIISSEKTILIELIEWQIYRVTVFDLLEEKKYIPGLSKLLKSREEIYGHDVMKTFKCFVNFIESNKTH
jgi:serine/threonine protein kinase